VYIHLHAYMKQFTSPYLHLICMETICLLFYWDNNQNFYIPFSFSSLQRGQTTPLPKHSESPTPPSPYLLYIPYPFLSFLNCTKNLLFVLPEMKMRGLVPNSYIHVSVSNLYIPRIGLPNSVLEIARPNSFMSGNT
jgi:hypothetical protein